MQYVIQDLIQKVSLLTFQRSEIYRPKITFSIFKVKLHKEKALSVEICPSPAENTCT